MALIIYPTLSYDSFCSLADAELILANYIQSSLLTDWNALSDDDKETLLRQATETVKGQIICLPETLEDDLKKATAYTANYSITTPTATDSGEGNIKIDEVVGVVKTEYFSPTKANALPDNVIKLLEQYCVTSGSGSFIFDRA